MKNRNGFTLIEVIVSIVLVSVVMVSLLGSLIQIRQTYTVIHEDSDIIVYSSSISRVINNDLAKNNGIRYCTCSYNGQECDIILGNNNKRHLEIIKKCYISSGEVNCEESHNKKTIKTTLKYTDTTNTVDKKTLYIRTLESTLYENGELFNATGYNFQDMSTVQYEHSKEGNDNEIDQYTTITIKLNNGINGDLLKYDVTLYAAGRYDYSNLVGKKYKLELNSNGASYTGTTSIDEIFGVGYFLEGKSSAVDQLSSKHKIDIPKNGDKAFWGYYYRPAGSTQEIRVIDPTGMIVATSRFFRDNVEFNLDNNPDKAVILAKWKDCEDGFKYNGDRCYPIEYNVTLNKNGGSGGPDSYKASFMSQVPDISQTPTKTGYTFQGYYNGSILYNDSDGKGRFIYDISSDSTATAQYTPNNYTVRFNPNGGSGGQSSNVTATYNSDMPAINTTPPTRLGYTFQGWFDNQLYTSGAKYYNANGTSARKYDKTTNTTLYAGWKMNTPQTPTLSGGGTKIYNQSNFTLTCSTSSYANGTNVYYEFGYATSSDGSVTWSGDKTTTSTLNINKSAYRGTRYYSCRVYAKDDVETSTTVTATSKIEVSLVNARINLDGNDGTIGSGTNPFYVEYGSSNKYTGRLNTTAATIPGSSRTNYQFLGYYTDSSNGSQVIKSDGTIVAGVSSWTDSNGKFIVTGTGNNENSNKLYAHWKSLYKYAKGTINVGAGNVNWPPNVGTYVFNYNVKLYYDLTKDSSGNVTGSAILYSNIVQTQNQNPTNWIKGTFAVGTYNMNFGGTIVNTHGSTEKNYWYKVTNGNFGKISGDSLSWSWTPVSDISQSWPTASSSGSNGYSAITFN